MHFKRMKMPRSHILNAIPREEWCTRFVAAWTAFELASERASLAEAHAAYEIAGMLYPDEAAMIVAEVRSQRGT